MPFGLTNAPSTFQALMNGILKPFIRKFTLVFFDDILIYSSSWTDHLRHVKQVFQLLSDNKLVLKRSKCSFGEPTMSYLGHIVSAQGVAMDPSKVDAVESWPIPRTLKALRGFLGLTGYYRKFIAGYGSVASPLTALLKRDAFQWTDEAAEAFCQLKQSLLTAPLLQLPDFTKRFFIDCDASGSGFGAVLHQGDGAIAFFSRPVSRHHQKLPAYERELIGLVKAVRHWRPYVWGRPFTVRTDHYSLKFLLDQRLSTIPQHTWVSKLFGYDITVEYRPGKLNGAADALSRRDEDMGTMYTISSPSFDLFATLKAEAESDSQVAAICKQLADGTASPVGLQRMVCYGSRAKYSFQRRRHYGLYFLPKLMNLVMKACKRQFTGGEHLFTVQKHSTGYVSSCAVVQFANATRLSTFIQLVCCNPCPFLLWFGLTYQWTSLRAFQRLVASQ
jgi:hypothetical protein